MADQGCRDKYGNREIKKSLELMLQVFFVF
jgi:hypothetical protein